MIILEGLHSYQTDLQLSQNSSIRQLSQNSSTDSSIQRMGYFKATPFSVELKFNLFKFSQPKSISILFHNP
ncbi:hypothetical protein VNO77_34421 [Canavalia gladiata]|uniref:Uncharacterized protein n=1 Tax=Canavalia gladiata TaxID=3824 RepID=A0AAN9KE76_CANGL